MRDNTGVAGVHNRAAEGVVGGGFLPAFLDAETGSVYYARNPDGSRAGCHRLDGLPDQLIAERTARGGVATVKASVYAGFEYAGRFYTREQAAAALSGVE